MSISALKHQRHFVEPNVTSQRLAEIHILLDALRQLQIGLPIKKRMLVHGIWEVAVATGGFCARYRSEAVIQTVGAKIQRDHIFKKKALITELLGPNPDIEKIIERGRCCIVTTDEHRKLHDVDESLDGWERYRVAGIVVYDMLDGKKIT
jgi:hypothetical protein